MTDPIAKYRTFLAVADAGSVTEAARRLFVSQPAVSADIAGLEDALGVCLFIRSRRGVRLTEAGEVLVEYVRSAFSLLETGKEKLRELSALEGGNLRIGASDMTLRFYLLDYIEAFHARYPAVRLTVTNATTPRTLEALRSGSIDFGVISGPLATQEEGLVLLPVRTVQDIFVAAPTHPLAGRERVTREDLCAHPVMMLEGNTSTRAYVTGWLGRDFPPPAIELATSDLLLEFAKRGIGISSIVADFAAKALADGEVVALRMAELPPPRPFYLVYSAGLPLSAAGRRMLSLLTDGIDPEK
ncbi:MAG: LysR family transcriptional regulator [Clostridia bacterium]|nr:LysR family transcriptional regulator [Clostridia bacterium]